MILLCLLCLLGKLIPILKLLWVNYKRVTTLTFLIPPLTSPQCMDPASLLWLTRVLLCHAMSELWQSALTEMCWMDKFSLGYWEIGQWPYISAVSITPADIAKVNIFISICCSCVCFYNLVQTQKRKKGELFFGPSRSYPHPRFLSHWEVRCLTTPFSLSA